MENTDQIENNTAQKQNPKERRDYLLRMIRKNLRDTAELLSEMDMNNNYEIYELGTPWQNACIYNVSMLLTVASSLIEGKER